MFRSRAGSNVVDGTARPPRPRAASATAPALTPPAPTASVLGAPRDLPPSVPRRVRIVAVRPVADRRVPAVDRVLRDRAAARRRRCRLERADRRGDDRGRPALGPRPPPPHAAQPLLRGA